MPGWLLAAALASAISSPTQASSRPSPFRSTLAQLAKVERTIEVFRLDCGRLPSTLDDLVTALRSYTHCWKGPAVRPEHLADIWGNPLVYVARLDGSFSLGSTGRDGRAGTGDDIPLNEAYNGEYDLRWYQLELSPVAWLALMASSIIFLLCLGIEGLRHLLRRRRVAVASVRESRAAAEAETPPES